MCTLLPPGFMVACSKWVLFIFLLEILTGDEGPKPELFWCAHKKCSRASQEVCLAMSQASNPVPHPPLPSLVPATSPEPPTPTTLLPAPSVSLLPLGLVSPETSETQPDDMVMSLPMASPPRMKLKINLSNQAFACMFPNEPYSDTQESINATDMLQKQWLAEAQGRDFNMGQVPNTVWAASKGEFIGKQFGRYLDANFTNLTLPGPNWSLFRHEVA
jgi:hypothetical protein